MKILTDTFNLKFKQVKSREIEERLNKRDFEDLKSSESAPHENSLI